MASCSHPVGPKRTSAGAFVSRRVEAPLPWPGERFGSYANVLRAALDGLPQKLRFATPEDRPDIGRAVLAKDENAVRIGPDRIEARLLRAPQARSGVAQVYRAG